jgi:serine/threonine-protein phosphatase 5
MSSLGFRLSPRGGGIFTFGPDITAKFLELNNLKRIIRSHQTVKHGYCIEHNNQCVTVFSAPHYRGRNNAGAIFQYEKDENDVISSTAIQFRSAVEAFRYGYHSTV